VPEDNNHQIQHCQIKKNEIGGTYGTNGKEEMCIQSLAVKHEGKIPFARPRHIMEDSIKVDLNPFVYVPLVTKGLRDRTGAWTGLIWLRLGTSGVLL
jgi:hypothetical protein